MPTIAATGHRPPRLPGTYSSATAQRLRDLAHTYLNHAQCDLAISGMALGWDYAFAHAANDLTIPFIAAIPFQGYELLWPDDSRNKYHWLLARAHKVIVVSPAQPYAPRLLQLRNEWMIDRADRIAALWDGTTHGGTYNAIAYARKRNPPLPIDNLWPQLKG